MAEGKGQLMIREFGEGQLQTGKSREEMVVVCQEKWHE